MGLVDSIRRILWLVPLLVLGSALLFWLFSSTLCPRPGELPLFFNEAPRHAEAEAESALRRVRAGEAGGAERLAVLGGAALPYVLGQLDTLPVSEQRKVATALWPVAERMRLWDREDVAGVSYDVESSDRKLLLWREYYEEHASDFRPLAVQRLVRRLSSRDLLLRRADLLVVDTYALPFLIEELGRVRTSEDVHRIERIAELISHVSGRDFRLRPGDGVRQARQRATELRAFWDRQGPAFTSMGRLELLSASLGQTEFALWCRSTLRTVSKVDDSALTRRLAAAAPVTLPLFACALFGAMVLGPALAALIQVLEMRRYVPLVGRAPVRIGLSLALCTLVPSSLLAAPERPLLTWVLAALAGTLSSAFVLGRELSERVDWRTHRVLHRRRAVGRVSAVLRWLGPSLPTLAPLVVSEAALWVACLELGSGLPGLGSETWQAVWSGDLNWLMMSSLGFGVLTGGMQLICDAFLGTTRFSWGEW